MPIAWKTKNRGKLNQHPDSTETICPIISWLFHLVRAALFVSIPCRDKCLSCSQNRSQISRREKARAARIALKTRQKSPARNTPIISMIPCAPSIQRQRKSAVDLNVETGSIKLVTRVNKIRFICSDQLGNSNASEASALIQFLE